MKFDDQWTGRPRDLRGADGSKPFQEWVESLKDYEAQARVFVRLLVIPLCGGNKATQRKDIADAKRYWRDYRSRKHAGKRAI
jgi:putative component of toxin-antitoxin plasmid stabilization module